MTQSDSIIRRHSTVFLACLGLVILLAGCIYMINDRISTTEVVSNRYADLGERQRLLSFRVVNQLGEYSISRNDEKRAAHRADAEAAIEEMEAIHKALTKGDPPMGVPIPESQAINAINFADPHNLDGEVAQYIQTAHDLLATPWDTTLPSSFYLSDMRVRGMTVVAEGLEALLNQYQQEYNDQTQTLRYLLMGVTVMVTVVLAIVGVAIVWPLLTSLTVQNKALTDLALLDPMTRCHNRGSFMELGAGELDRYRRYENRLALIVMEIDTFEDTRKKHHVVPGDEFVKALASTSLTSLRKSDALGRLGGETFAIILPEAPLDKAMLVAEKLRQSIEQSIFTNLGQTFQFTISLGVTTGDVVNDNSFADTLSRAERNLKRARDQGRNQVVGIAIG